MKAMFLALLWLGLSTWVCPAAENYRLDPTNSLIRIHLGTAGVFGSLGHEHLIQTPLQEGTFAYEPREPARSSVELVVDTRRMQVVDPGTSARDKEKIQATMESDRVLGIKQFPAIKFRSTSIQTQGTNHLLILGDLTIRGKTKPVTVHAELVQTTPRLIVSGQSQFKQTEFGIKPVSAGMGTVKVRDQMTISFQIFGGRSQGQ